MNLQNNDVAPKRNKMLPGNIAGFAFVVMVPSVVVYLTGYYVLCLVFKSCS